MPRFFIPPDQIQKKRFVLAGSEAHHASRVLRMKTGDAITLFDGQNLSYHGEITSIYSDRVEGEILSRQTGSAAPVASVILYQALIKAVKWDWLVEKACEVGVAKLVPLVSARTIIKPSGDRAIERWKRIALAAAKQCGRNDVMEIEPSSPLSEAIKNLPEGHISFIPWEKENSTSIRQALQHRAPHPASGHLLPKGEGESCPIPGGDVNIFIGPEGGWEAQEVELAVRHHVVPVRLGPTLLRSETAGVVAAALVLSECEADA